MGEIITVAGAKGGVGKTTPSLNLGASIAAENHRTVVVELDLGMANVVDFLSLPDSDAPTLHGVLDGTATLGEAIQSLDSGLHVLPSGTNLEGYASADLDRLPSVANKLREEFETIIFDTGAGLNRSVVESLGLADDVILVSTPRVAAIRDAEKTKQLAERVDSEVVGLVLTKSGTGRAPGPDRIADFLGVDLLGHVPEDQAVPAAQDEGVPVVQSDPKSEAGRTYREVSSRLLAKVEDTEAHIPEPESPDRPGKTTDPRGSGSATADGGRTTKPPLNQTTASDSVGPVGPSVVDMDSGPTDTPPEDDDTADAESSTVRKVPAGPERPPDSTENQPASDVEEDDTSGVGAQEETAGEGAHEEISGENAQEGTAGEESEEKSIFGTILSFLG
jgi:septum site-determining protein MinD